jgi:mannose-6-phosphate isomerase-like protein (cupin superfamily)
VTVSLLPGAEFHTIWGADATVPLPSNGDLPPMQGWFPPAGGFRFAFFTLPPAGTGARGDPDMVTAFAELNQKLPGLFDVMEQDNPGMHTTDTIDIDLVISGEVRLELDDGAEVQLKAGDCVVQNGTRHRWQNRSDRPCVMAVALIGAKGTR